MRRFSMEGVDLRTAHRAKEFLVEDGRKMLLCEHQGRVVPVEFDEILVAVGRTARVRGYGLEELGIPVDETVIVDEYLATKFPNIYACGDVVGPYQFTHVAAHQARYAAMNALFGSIKRFRVGYSVIPWATFTDPEVARVGLNEVEARERSVAYEVTTYGLDDLDRAITDGEAYGLVKVLTVPGKDRILGVTIVGAHAGDLIAEYVVAMRMRLGLGKILETIHIYPTLADANRRAAGKWREAHVPERVLGWMARYHAWRRA
jgi:pyruvate/2-oxoglutarate dehydrogenase complex dihydrolipoamide dehydrogenase (E3) component